MLSKRAIARAQASANCRARAARKAAERELKKEIDIERELEKIIREYAETPEERRARPASTKAIRLAARKRLLETANQLNSSPPLTVAPKDA